MKVIPRMPITDSVFQSSTVAEADAPAWSAATAYTVGQKVMVTTGVHRVYARLVAGTTATPPQNDPTNWLDLGATNRWRMLHADGDYKTSGASPMVIVLKPPERVTALAIIGLEADTIKVELKDASNAVVFSVQESLVSRTLLNWFDYFYSPFELRSAFLTLSLLPIIGASIVITLTRAAGNVACGAIAMGVPIDLGKVLPGASVGAQSFSRIDRNTFGDSIVQVRRSVPRTSQSMRLERMQVEKARKTLTELAGGRSAMFLGIADATHGYFNSLAVLGLVKQWDIVLDEFARGTLSLDLEGL